jgi:putative transposase
VENYRVRPHTPSSPTWKLFLKNHMQDLVALDFFTVSSVKFRVLFVPVILAHERRRVVHFNITEHLTAVWTAQQVTEVLPREEGPRDLPRDRDRTYGAAFQQRVLHIGIEEVVSAPRSPWQNPYVERFIGSVRLEPLDHVMVLNTKHLMRLLTEYIHYYHHLRMHLSLAMDCPELRPIHPPECGTVITVAEVGGAAPPLWTAGNMKRKESDMASSRPALEQRVAALEAEVTKLKRKIDAIETTKPWWEHIAGTFQNDPLYEQAMRLGRQYRQSLRPKKPTRSQQ